MRDGGVRTHISRSGRTALALTPPPGHCGKEAAMARPRSEQPDKPPKPLPVECCPPLDRDGTCDVIDFRYRLIHRAPTGGEPAIALVEVILHYRLERCPGPLTLGELVYTTTLLPGEKVRLFTTDRKTRFTFDSEHESQPPERADHRGAVLHVEHGRLHVGPHGHRPAEHDQYGIGLDVLDISRPNGATASLLLRPFGGRERKLQREDDERLHAPAPTARRLLGSPFRTRRSDRKLRVDRRGVDPDSMPRALGRPLRIVVP